MTEEKKPHAFAHVPTEKSRAEVSSLTSFGHTQAEIARYLSINVETLANHYRYELDNSALIANHAVANKLYKKCIEQDDLKAQIFWLKTKGRWKTADGEEKGRMESIVEALLAQIKS